MKMTRHEEALEEMKRLKESNIEFKRLEKYPLYRIYNNGVIIKDRSNSNKNDFKLLKHSISVKGYHTVNVYDKNMKERKERVHRLVALAFVEGETNVKNIVNHIDGNKDNNHVDNLEWCSIIYNNRHAIEQLGVSRKGESNGSSKLTESQVLDIRERHENGESVKDLVFRYDLNKSTINRIVKRETWKHI